MGGELARVGWSFLFGACLIERSSSILRSLARDVPTPRRHDATTPWHSETLMSSFCLLFACAFAWPGCFDVDSSSLEALGVACRATLLNLLRAILWSGLDVAGSSQQERSAEK